MSLGLWALARLVFGPPDTSAELVLPTDTWSKLFSLYAPERHIRDILVAGARMDPSATLAASGIATGAVIHVGFAGNSGLLGGMMLASQEEDLSPSGFNSPTLRQPPLGLRLLLLLSLLRMTFLILKD